MSINFQENNKMSDSNQAKKCKQILSYAAY